MNNPPVFVALSASKFRYSAGVSLPPLLRHVHESTNNKDSDTVMSYKQIQQEIRLLSIEKRKVIYTLKVCLKTNI